jgi:2'-5' RNA ligase
VSRTGPAGRDRRAGLFVVVPADDLVGDFRRRHHSASVARRLPPHVTIRFPFRPVADVDDALCAELTRHFSGLASFAAELTGVGSFARHVWLAPEPRDRFVELMQTTRVRFQEASVGEDAHREPVPHLTIGEARRGEDVERLAALAREELEPLLPFGFVVAAVSLLEEGADGLWHELSRFELA